jgi:hypothetical protein
LTRRRSSGCSSWSRCGPWERYAAGRQQLIAEL